MSDNPMTIVQRRLARHALGLPNKYRRSYRNFYSAHASSRFAETWADMIDLGFARLAGGQSCANLIGFALTLAGAERAVEPGEKLCPEDFPASDEVAA